MTMIGQNGNNNLDKILLIDSSFDLELLKEKENEYKKIITFDYDVHKILLNNKIDHVLSESFLKSFDLEKIEKYSYHSMKWFENYKISQLLNYKEVNLGQLIIVEFHYFLLSFLKIFVELSRVFEVYGDLSYYCSPNLFETMKFIAKDTVKINDKLKNKNQFLYDVISYDVRIWKISYSIKLSQESFMKLKNVSEVFFQKLTGRKKHNPNYSTTLLLNFDPLRYKKFLLDMNKTSLNVVLFNRRRPTIWNFESFFIAKKSKCIIENNFSLVDELVNKSISDGLDKLKEKITLLEKQEFFLEFFVLDQKSFWEIIKTKLFDLAYKRFKEAIREIEITEKLLKKYKFNSILILSENGFNERIIISLAKSRNIPIILLQHGLGYDTPELPEGLRELVGTIPRDSSKLIIWGSVTHRYLKKIGVMDNKIEILGSIIHDIFFEKSLQKPKNYGYVLLTTSSPTNIIASDLKVETIQRYEMAIKKISEATFNLNKKLVVKLHPAQDEMDVTEWVKKINKKISVIKFADTSRLIQNCDLVITIDISTTILESQLLKKPVIVVLAKKYNWGIPEVYSSDSCLITEIDDIENTLKMLDDNIFRNKLIQKGTEFANQYLINDGNATDRLLKFLQKF